MLVIKGKPLRGVSYEELGHHTYVPRWWVVFLTDQWTWHPLSGSEDRRSKTMECSRFPPVRVYTAMAIQEAKIALPILFELFLGGMLSDDPSVSNQSNLWLGFSMLDNELDPYLALDHPCLRPQGLQNTHLDLSDNACEHGKPTLFNPISA
jgi:hypothetical protein